MNRRIIFTLLAAFFAGNTGCCGHVRSFFYRITHCHGCCPGYGYGYAAPVESGPVVYGGAAYGAGGPGCTSCNSAPVGPMAYTQPTASPSPIFSGVPQSMPGGPSVYPSTISPEPPMAKPMGTK